MLLQKSRHLGHGATVTLTRKNSGTLHDPKPTTERGKRREAKRAEKKMANLELMANLAIEIATI